MEHIKTGADAMEQSLQDQLQRSERNQETRSTSPSSSCELCGDRGWIHSEIAGTSGVSRCVCARRRIIEMKMSAIPRRFANCSFENYIPTDDLQVVALETVRGSIDCGMFIHGGYGRGKTHLAVAQYRALVSAGQECAFRSVSELITELREFELKGEFSKVLDRAKYADEFHLFVDDIDKFKPTEFKAESFHELFNTIYSRKLSVTVTTNWDMQTLVENERISPAIVRRLDDMCLAVRV